MLYGATNNIGAIVHICGERADAENAAKQARGNVVELTVAQAAKVTSSWPNLVFATDLPGVA